MTHQQILIFSETASAWLNDPEHQAETKFVYALRKMLRRAKPHVQVLREQSDDIQIEHAAEDKDQVLRRDATGNLCYTKAEMHKRNTALRELSKQEIVIEPHFVDPPACVLKEAEREAFLGFVLVADPDEEG